MKITRPQFIEQLLQLCKQYGLLTIFDECMTGFGKTGKMFALDHLQHKPDVICLSKALTGGFLPLALTVTTNKIYEAFLAEHFDKALAHGHSYTANPLGCAAANASIALFKTENTLNKIAAIEKEYYTFGTELLKLPNVENVRILGAVFAFDVKSNTKTGYNNAIGSILKADFLEAGLLIRPLGNVVYLLPPFCIDIQNSLHYAFEKILAILLKHSS